MLFGQYLIAVGAVRPEGVLAALDAQHRAVEKGFLSADVLLELLDTQANTKQKVGVIAVTTGRMTADQVQAVLDLQKEQRRPLGVMLVRLGTISEGALKTHLAAYFAKSP
jgi:phage tail tape-measure protein